MHINNDFSDRREVLFFKDYYNRIKGKILDIGCGTGNASEWYDDYTGITTNPDEVAEGIRRNRNIVLCDAHQLNMVFRPSIFNGFIMWDTLEHFYSPYIALLEAKQVLKEGGKGLIFMPGQNWLTCHDHIHTMTKPQMLHLFNRTNFKVLEANLHNYPDGSDGCGMAVYVIQKDSTFKAEYNI